MYRRRRITVLATFALVIAGVAIGMAAAGAGPGRVGGSSPAASKRASRPDPARAPSRAASGPRAARWTVGTWLAGLEARAADRPGHLQPGSDPGAVPGPILIADRNNNRLLIVDARGRVLWQFPPPGTHIAFKEPDDAFFTPDGADILATQEDDSTISEISLRTDRIVWHYGHPGHPGSARGYVHNPDDAMVLPNGNVVTADIKNCRLLYLSTRRSVPLHVYGETTPYCYHEPPARFGSPNGMFPMTNGDWLVTEINGDWVDEMTPSGHIVWSTNPPGISYPSDTNEVSPDRFLTVAYTNPGAIEELTRTGQLLWRYAPSGRAALDQPSLALPLPNGDILANDDWNHRVIVVDPRTNRIVWQYGHTGHPGRGAGWLAKPDGVDLAPPHSLAATHAATEGVPPF